MGQCVALLRQSNSEELGEFVRYLTPDRVHGLRQSWNLCVRNCKIGENILLTLIQKQPHLATNFGIPLNTNDMEIKRLDCFVMQALRIQAFLDNIILSLDSVHEVVLREMCNQIGCIHFYKGVNLAEESWAMFQFAMLREIVKQCRINGHYTSKQLAVLRQNWILLLDAIVQQIRAGFLNEALSNFFNKQSFSVSPNMSFANRRSMQSTAEFNPGSGLLTTEESVACYDSWQIAKRVDVGMRIITMMILHKPAYARHFDVDPEMARADMAANNKLKLQARRITGFYDTIVNLYGVLTTDKIKMHCRRVGMVHFSKGVNFTADSWLIFKRITIENITSTSSPPRVITQRSRSCGGTTLAAIAWDKLMRFVVHEMKEGFLEKARAQRKVSDQGANTDRAISYWHADI